MWYMKLLAKLSKSLLFFRLSFVAAKTASGAREPSARAPMPKPLLFRKFLREKMSFIKNSL